LGNKKVALTSTTKAVAGMHRQTAAGRRMAPNTIVSTAPATSTTADQYAAGIVAMKLKPAVTAANPSCAGRAERVTRGQLELRTVGSLRNAHRDSKRRATHERVNRLAASRMRMATRSHSAPSWYWFACVVALALVGLGLRIALGHDVGYPTDMSHFVDW